MPAEPNPKITNKMGSILVGVIGAYGSPADVGGGSSGYYTHVHMLFQTWNGNKKTKRGKELTQEQFFAKT